MIFVAEKARPFFLSFHHSQPTTVHGREHDHVHVVSVVVVVPYVDVGHVVVIIIVVVVIVIVIVVVVVDKICSQRNGSDDKIEKCES